MMPFIEPFPYDIRGFLFPERSVLNEESGLVEVAEHVLEDVVAVSALQPTFLKTGGDMIA
jgi:hypothetical protein